MEGAGDWVAPVLAALFPARRRRGDRQRDIDQRAMWGTDTPAGERERHTHLRQ